jgi:hypothetical protein
MILGMIYPYKTQNRSKIRRIGPELPIEGGECTIKTSLWIEICHTGMISLRDKMFRIKQLGMYHVSVRQ